MCSCVPPVWVCGSSVLYDIVRAESHDGPHGAVQAVLRLDEHGVPRITDVLSGDTAAQFKGRASY